jgi:MoaA/NifB/PqqE/SkfB family radical SAM enzyme
MRKWKKVHRKLREWRVAGKALLDQDHPVLAHIIPIRRCNLSCSYCNEYDKHSRPVSLAVMIKRIDCLAGLRTSVVTISGGEPLLHPGLETIIAHIRSRGIVASLITNGYLLTRKRIEAFNRAGLEHLQISIDNVRPDAVSKKSLKVLDRKLRYLSESAEFAVNINSVLGSAVRNPDDALAIGKRAIELGFTCTVGIVHSGDGQLQPLSRREREIFDELKDLGKRGYTRMYRYFQENLARGKPNNWSCRAGARYLYICENGLVHYCSQQRGYPGIPLEKYTVQDIRREHRTVKGCAPFCTVSCVHDASLVDFWRAPQDLPEPARLPKTGTADGLVRLR